jgi:hypothetical protein
MANCLVVLSVASMLPLAAPPAQAPDAKAPGKDRFAAVQQARQGGYRMLLRQFRAEEPQLGERHEAGARDALPEYQGQRDLPAAHWVWVKPCWFLFRDGPGHEIARASWGPEQAAGAPDTPAAGDHGSAWATREEDAAGEWLLLEFAAPVRATKLEVHETFHPGALARVTVFNAGGDELEVWQAAQVGPAAEPKRALAIDLPRGFTVERVKLYLQSEKVPGWNEIDAVGLHDEQGGVHWAACAEASSTFATAEQRAKLMRAVVAARPMPVRVEVGELLQRAAREHVVQVAPDLRVRAVIEQARLRAVPPPAGEQPPAAGAPPPADGALAAQVGALQARIAALEKELASVRVELAKLRAAANK